MTRTCLFVGALALFGAGAALAQTHQPAHHSVDPATLQWIDAPPGLPAGAKQALLYGDPSKSGQFVLRARLPAGYRIAPHTHPTREMVTVLSGSMRLGFGPSGDLDQASTMSTGAFVAMDPGTIHYLQANQETVIQVAGEGPFQIVYVNPADDPRNSPPQERGGN